MESFIERLQMPVIPVALVHLLLKIDLIDYQDLLTAAANSWTASSMTCFNMKLFFLGYSWYNNF